jgi:hypothetical protein
VIRSIAVGSQTEANSSGDPISKKKKAITKKGVAQGVGPEFKPQYRKKKKKRLNLNSRQPIIW